MNREIKQGIAELTKEYGFRFKKKAYYRVVNDVVQGFHFRESRAMGLRRFKLEFATYPLSDPYSNLYNFFFEHQTMDLFIPKKDPWGYYYDPENTESLMECIDSIKTDLETYLFAYFEEYNSCMRAIPDLPESNGYCADWISAFFALSAGERKLAEEWLQQLQKNNEEAYEENSKYFSAEEIKQMRKNREPYENQIKELLEFCQTATEEEMKEYLQKNKERAREFLK